MWERTVLGALLLLIGLMAVPPEGDNLVRRMETDDLMAPRAVLFDHVAMIVPAWLGAWLLMKKGEGSFPPRVRAAGILVLLNTFMLFNFLESWQPMSGLRPMYRNGVYSGTEYWAIIGFYIFLLFGTMAIGLWLWTWKFFLTSDPKEEWRGWRPLVRASGAVLLAGALSSLFGVKAMFGSLSWTGGMSGITALHVCVAGGIGAYLLAGYPAFKKGPWRSRSELAACAALFLFHGHG